MQLSDLTHWHQYLLPTRQSAPKLLDRVLVLGQEYLDPLISSLPDSLQAYLRPDQSASASDYWYPSLLVIVASIIAATAFTMSRYSPRAFHSPRASRDFSQDFSYVSPEDLPSSMNSSTASRSRPESRKYDHVDYVFNRTKCELIFSRDIFPVRSLEVGDLRKEIARMKRVPDERCIRLERDGIVLDDDASLCHLIDVPTHDGDERVQGEQLVYADLMSRPEHIRNYQRHWRADDFEKVKSATSPRSSTRSFFADEDDDRRQREPQRPARRRRPSTTRRRKQTSGPSESMPNLGRSSPPDPSEDFDYFPASRDPLRMSTGPSRPSERPNGSPTTPTSTRERRYSQSEHRPKRRESAQPTNRPVVEEVKKSSPSLEQLHANEKQFYSDVLPMIKQFLDHPPPDRKDYEKEKLRLDELITRTCEQNDGLNFEPGEAGREEKRALTKTALDYGRRMEGKR